MSSCSAFKIYVYHIFFSIFPVFHHFPTYFSSPPFTFHLTCIYFYIFLYPSLSLLFSSVHHFLLLHYFWSIPTVTFFFQNATEGRMMAHLQETPGFSLKCSGVKVLILDEADRLLDMGFKRWERKSRGKERVRVKKSWEKEREEKKSIWKGRRRKEEKNWESEREILNDGNFFVSDKEN